MPQMLATVQRMNAGVVLGVITELQKCVSILEASLLPARTGATLDPHHLSSWGFVRPCLLSFHGAETKGNSEFQHSLPRPGCVLKTKKASELGRTRANTGQGGGPALALCKSDKDGPCLNSGLSLCSRRS